MTDDDVGVDSLPMLLVEQGTKTDGEIVFFAISGFILWIFATLFLWIIAGYFTRNKQKLNLPIIIAAAGVLLFSWLDGFTAFILKTNVFLHDTKYIMQYECAQCLHSTALFYGLYRYSLYMFFLFRIRHFFKGTSHEFRRQKCVAAFLFITIFCFCFVSVLVFYLTPSIITANKYQICYPQLNDELREEILIFLIMDVFISLYLTWLFVIKSRALLALQTANNNNNINDIEEEQKEEEIENNDVNYGIDHINMPMTYFIDESNGGLKSQSVRRLMLRCIYLGMLAMLTTWIHLGLRFVEFSNLQCIEEFVNCCCILLSFDISAEGNLVLFCWCGVDMGDLHGYGAKKYKRRKNKNNKKEYNSIPNTEIDNTDNTDLSDLNQ